MEAKARIQVEKEEAFHLLVALAQATAAMSLYQQVKELRLKEGMLAFLVATATDIVEKLQFLRLHQVVLEPVGMCFCQLELQIEAIQAILQLLQLLLQVDKVELSLYGSV